jgi:mono/diheme cytochrome c family protein
MRKKRSSSGRRLGYLVLVVAVVGVGVLAYYATRPGALAFAGGQRVPLDQYQGQPTGVPADFKDTDPIARGRYLADAADCRSCHTAEGGAAFAGGRPFKLPFGTLYTTNITPDKATGIGDFTDAQFIDAVRNGIGPRGGRLYPAMPYAS